MSESVNDSAVVTEKVEEVVATEITENAVLVKWQEIKRLLADVETDVIRNSRGIAAAGVRLRKLARKVVGEFRELNKLTIETDKANKEARSKLSKAKNSYFAKKHAAKKAAEAAAAAVATTT